MALYLCLISQRSSAVIEAVRGRVGSPADQSISRGTALAYLTELCSETWDWTMSVPTVSITQRQAATDLSGHAEQFPFSTSGAVEPASEQVPSRKL